MELGYGGSIGAVHIGLKAGGTIPGRLKLTRTNPAVSRFVGDLRLKLVGNLPLNLRKFYGDGSSPCGNAVRPNKRWGPFG